MNLQNITNEQILKQAKCLYMRDDFLERLKEILPKEVKVTKLYTRGLTEETDKVSHVDFWLVDLYDHSDWANGFTLDYNAIKKFFGGRN